MRGLFITGTDTGVGKTHIACELVRELRAVGHRVGAFKPACSGASIEADGRPHWDDVERLRDALGRDVSDDQLCPQRFLAPLAPPIAAQQEGRAVDLGAIERGLDAWRSECDIVIVEGAGGLLCPLTNERTMADLAAQFGFPLLIVARLGLGTINHTLLTVEVARQRGLPLAGIVFNEPLPTTTDNSSATNAAEVAARCDVPVLAIRRHDSTGWRSRFGQATQLDWWTLAGVP
ncbi:MAG: dethiobiotin synthase [Planctomycetota bacterium]|nr:MAG: dethiobiotin synthase [Planctomycetota bacterium]GDY10059.1 ATP-dependent dethiobiotin synthetase BioD [Planctomycetia bacterium]